MLLCPSRCFRSFECTSHGSAVGSCTWQTAAPLFPWQIAAPLFPWQTAALVLPWQAYSPKARVKYSTISWKGNFWRGHSDISDGIGPAQTTRVWPVGTGVHIRSLLITHACTRTTCRIGVFVQYLVYQVLEGSRLSQHYVSSIDEGVDAYRDISPLNALWQLLKSLVTLQKGVVQFSKTASSYSQEIAAASATCDSQEIAAASATSDSQEIATASATSDSQEIAAASATSDSPPKKRICTEKTPKAPKDPIEAAMATVRNRILILSLAGNQKKDHPPLVRCSCPVHPDHDPRSSPHFVHP